MEHEQAIKILREKADRSEYGIGSNKLDLKRLLDDYDQLTGRRQSIGGLSI